MRSVFYSTLVSLIALSYCTPQKGMVLYTADDIVPNEKSLLWSIKGNGLKKESYLFGTIHLIPKSELKFSESTKKALKSAKLLTFEIDLKKMMNLKSQVGLMTKAFMKNGTTLRDLLSPEDYAYVRTKMDGKGLPMTMLERMKPMFTSTMLSADEEKGGANATGMTSVEMELYSSSKQTSKETGGLETADYQLSLFDSIPYKEQAKMLMESLRSVSNESSQFDEMLAMYKTQDIQAMERMMKDEKSGISQYGDLLLYGRNANWIPVMSQMMQKQSTFFAVGAGHLGGEKGVVTLLRKAGYKVQAIPL